MIHLDANLLIALVKPSDGHHPAAARVVSLAAPLGSSSIAWMELFSKPVHPGDKAALQAILSAGIHPFDETCADLAGELYHRTGSKRRTRLDTMIAASAILAGAELATVNPADFAPFVPHGLKLLVPPVAETLARLHPLFLPEEEEFELPARMDRESARHPLGED